MALKFQNSYLTSLSPGLQSTKWGPVFWYVLHWILAYSEQFYMSTVREFVLLVFALLPCQRCRTNARQNLLSFPIPFVTLVDNRHVAKHEIEHSSSTTNENDAVQQLRKWLFEFHNCVNQQCGKPEVGTFQHWNLTFPAIPTTEDKVQFHDKLLQMLYALVWNYPDSTVSNKKRTRTNSNGQCQRDRDFEQRRQLYLHLFFLFPFVIPRLLYWPEFWQLYGEALGPHLLRLAHPPPTKRQGFLDALCELHFMLVVPSGKQKRKDEFFEEKCRLLRTYEPHAHE